MKLFYAISALWFSSVYASSAMQKSSLHSSGRTSPLKPVKGTVIAQTKKETSSTTQTLQEPSSSPIVINFLGTIKSLIKVVFTDACPPLADESAVALALQQDAIYKPFMLNDNLLTLDRDLWDRAGNMIHVPNILQAFGLNPARSGGSQCLELVHTFVTLFIPLLDNASEVVVKPREGQVVHMNYLHELPYSLPVSKSRMKAAEAMRSGSNPARFPADVRERIRAFPIVASRSVANFISAAMELFRQLKKKVDADKLSFEDVLAHDLISLWAYAKRRNVASAFIELIAHGKQPNYKIIAEGLHKLFYELGLSYNKTWRWLVAREMADEDAPSKSSATSDPTSAAKDYERAGLGKNSNKLYLAETDFIASLSRAFMTQVLPPLWMNESTLRSMWDIFTESPFYALLSNPAYALVRSDPDEAASFFAHAISDLVSSKPTHLNQIANAYVTLLLNSSSSSSSSSPPMDQKHLKSALDSLCESMLCYIPGGKDGVCSLPKWIVPPKKDDTK